MTKNYFALEYGGKYKDHIGIADDEGNEVFQNYLDMTYDEMKSQDDLEDFVVAVMDAVIEDNGDNAIITLVDEDGIFIWSILMGVVNDDLRFNLVDWRQDGHMYRYAPENNA